MLKGVRYKGKLEKMNHEFEPMFYQERNETNLNEKNNDLQKTHKNINIMKMNP